jgi:hypothetical protein
MKTAMQNLLEGVTFEKVAARLDRDIHILKTAGESGMNMGMQKRAGAYIDQLLEQCEMTPEEFDQVFEKVAGEAIMGDLVVAQAHLSEGLDEDGLAWLNEELTKIGAEMTEGAIMEKKAFLGALLAGGRAAIGVGARAVAGKAAAIPSAIRAGRIARGTKALAKTEAAVAKQHAGIAALKAKGKGGGMREAYREGAAKHLSAKTDKIRSKIGDLEKKQLSSEAAKLKGFGITPKGAPKTPSPNVDSPSSLMKVKGSQKSKGGFSGPAVPGKQATNDFFDAAPAGKDMTRSAPKAPAAAPKAPAAAPKAPDAAPKAPDAKGGDPELAAKTISPGSAPGKADDLANAAAGEGAVGATLKGSWEKMRDGGWKSLSGEEKQKLINAGVATVVGGRVLTGHGILTGGEGII